jgi:molybdenum cofactor biosynthesis enzyme MoaA
MMRFPLRLMADINVARIAKKLGFPRGAGPIRFLDVAEILHLDPRHPVSHEKIREVISSRSPVVWIGGSEPLIHPGIAHLVRAITGSGHFVFLETDGTVLRRRIHEFQPVSRLFLTVRLELGAQNHASRSLRTEARDLAVEGLRAARLSGFSICVHGRVNSETEMSEVAELRGLANSNDVDGMVISAASREANCADADASASLQKAGEARKLIGSVWWESFSRLIESAVSSETDTARSVKEKIGAPVEQESRTDEEGVKVL